MKIAPAYRIEQFCEKHTESRFVLEYVLVTTFHGKPVAVAANGFICGVVPVEMDDEDIGGLVHRSIFDRRTAAERKMAIHLGPQHAELESGWRAPRFRHPQAHLAFPNWLNFIRHEREATSTPGGVLTIAPALLNRAARSLGLEEVMILRQSSTIAPVIVTGEFEKDRALEPPFALVMGLYRSAQ